MIIGTEIMPIFCKTISQGNSKMKGTPTHWPSTSFLMCIKQSVSVIQLKTYSRQPVCTCSGYLSVCGTPWVGGVNRTLSTFVPHQSCMFKIYCICI